MTTTRSTRFARSAAIAVAVLLCSAPARAEDESLTARAEAHFNEGRRLLDLGEFAKAAAEYKKAYDLVPHPELLYHLGQANRLQGKKQLAIEFYKKYLAIEPNGRAADKSRRYLELLEKAVADEKARAEWTSTVQPEDDQSGGAGGPVDQSAQSASNDARSYEPDFAGTRPAVDDGPHDAGRGLRIGGMAAAGVGLISLAVGIKFGLDASSLSDDLSEPRAAWTDAELARFDDGESKERNAIIFGTLGGALVVAGGVVYVLGHRESTSAENRTAVHFAPVVGNSRLGVALGGAF